VYPNQGAGEEGPWSTIAMFDHPARLYFGPSLSAARAPVFCICASLQMGDKLQLATRAVDDFLTRHSGASRAANVMRYHSDAASFSTSGVVDLKNDQGAAAAAAWVRGVEAGGASRHVQQAMKKLRTAAAGADVVFLVLDGPPDGRTYRKTLSLGTGVAKELGAKLVVVSVADEPEEALVAFMNGLGEVWGPDLGAVGSALGHVGAGLY